MSKKNMVNFSEMSKRMCYSSEPHENWELQKDRQSFRSTNAVHDPIVQPKYIHGLRISWHMPKPTSLLSMVYLKGTFMAAYDKNQPQK